MHHLSHAIRMNKVRKTFGKKVAVEGIDLELPEGSLYGFIGPHGAGKTTSIRMVMSILFPDSGELEVLGRKSAVESKDRIGYLPEERGVYRKMKVHAFLEHMGRLKGLDAGGALKARVADWLERVELGEVSKKKCEELSKVMQQKIQFISCVLHEPDLLILDEPFSGLDPVNMRLLRDLIREQNEAGRTVIFSTHVMQQAEELCDHIVMIHEGRKVLDNTLGEIQDRFDPRAISFASANGELDESGVLAIPGVKDVRRRERGYEATVEDGAQPLEVLRSIVSGLRVTRAELRRPTLEDVFISIVRGEGLDEEGARQALSGEAES
ncbi:MAG: ABC transporter ATP-binding protein [Phycisphaerales bacterium JB059]